MIKLLILLFAVINITLSSSAQTSIGGVVGGVMTGATSSSPPHEAKYKRSFMIGGILNYAFDSIWSFQIQPAYIVKGATMYYPWFLSGAERITPEWSYAEFGMFLVGEHDLGPVHIGGIAGITPSLLLDGETTVDAWNVSTGEFEAAYTTDLKDQMMLFDVAFSFGVSVRYSITSAVDILGQARRSVGMVELFQQGGGSYRSRDDRIQVGVMIEL